MVKASTIGDYGEWELKDILIEGADQDYSDNSLAIGWWDGTPVLASRYDVRLNQASRCGYPFGQGGAPRWYVLPEWMWVGVVAAAPLTEDKRKAALNHLFCEEAG
jgi:hypothetical protein